MISNNETGEVDQSNNSSLGNRLEKTLIIDNHFVTNPIDHRL